VKQRDDVPIESEWYGEHVKGIMRKIDAEIEKKTAK